MEGLENSALLKEANRLEAELRTHVTGNQPACIFYRFKKPGILEQNANKLARRALIFNHAKSHARRI